MGKILSIVPTWDETLEKAKSQGYVYIKTPKQNGGYWVHPESINHLTNKVFLYPEIILSQKNYGITWALSKEELEK